jgi:hypothetical protein
VPRLYNEDQLERWEAKIEKSKDAFSNGALNTTITIILNKTK